MISGGYRCPLCDDDAASRPPILAATRQLTNLMPKMLRYSDDDAPARTKVREALDEICSVANWMTRELVVEAPATQRTAADSAAMTAIAELMDGEQWSPDTLEVIAQVIRATGRTIAEPC